MVIGSQPENEKCRIEDYWRDRDAIGSASETCSD